MARFSASSAVIERKTVVVGLGNPILSDDGVGIRVAELLREQVIPNGGFEVIIACVGGLRLMEALVGYRRAIIVDAMLSGSRPPGSVQLLPLEATGNTRNLFCAHDGELVSALALGRDLGLELPEQIEIVGIEAEEVEVFSEDLSARVAAAVPVAVALVRERLGVI